MSQTTARPRRKAATNKSYNDSIDLTSLDYDSSNSMSSSNSTNSTTRRRNTHNSNGNKKSTPKQDDNGTTKNSNGTTTNGNISVSIGGPTNWQPLPKPEDYFSFKLNLTDAYIDLSAQTLYCPNQFKSGGNSSRRKGKPLLFSLTKGQYIYMISEPPGEPYYIGRIIGFKLAESVHQKPVITHNNTVDAKNYLFQIQWFYRPRDISKITSDSRLLYASMHTDTCPISSFRGMVEVRHKQDIEDEHNQAQTRETKRGAKKSVSPSPASALEVYTQEPNHFYFDKLFDRYMIKFYDVLSTANLLQYAEIENSKSRNFLIALNKRFEFIFVESQRTKSLINSFSANSCNCEICGQWCDNSDSISCVECEKYYHMFCLDPPLLKKPSRGFSWSCASCTKKHELEYHQKKIVMLSDNKSSNQDQLASELSVLSSLEAEVSQEEYLPVSQEITETVKGSLPKYEILAIDFLQKDKSNSFEQRRLKEEWSMRYLGQYARLEDGVDLDDRSPYPRASTRIGTRHQAAYVPECDDHPIVYYDVEKPQPKKKSNGNSNKRPKSRNTDELVDLPKLEVPKEFEDTDPKDYPAWLQPRPKGYIERGVDDGDGETCTLLWKNSSKDVEDGFQKLDAYVAKCAPIAESIGISPNSPNFVDAILLSYMNHDGDVEKAFKESQSLDKKKLKEPIFTKEEIKKFENGVRKYGSELHPIQKLVKTQPSSMIVRFYYLWKKTPNGRDIWGNFEGRIQKKIQNIVKDEHTKPVKQQLDDLANPEDDSSYEDSKIIAQSTQFICKHCNTDNSIQWYRITGYDAKRLNSDKKVVGLCFRCAKLWRRYAVVWENPMSVIRKGSKRVDSELLQDATSILQHNEEMGIKMGTLDDKQSSVDVKQETKKRPSPSATSPNKKRIRVKEEKPEIPKSISPPIASNQIDTTNNSNNSHNNEKITSLLYNKNYVIPEVKKLVKKLPLESAKEYISELINTFRVRQLTDVYGHLSTIQIPSSSIELPFEPSERNCCVCREHDNFSKSSLLEMLICSSCGVNVHASCAGISIPKDQALPVKQWLCEPCTNDMRPVHSAIYTCCCCLAHESNYELSILGSPFVRPDYLKPIDNGKWCHLLCAVFNNDSSILFNKPQEVSEIHSSISVVNVDKVFLNNHRLVCEICESKNGALIKCELCNDHPHYYHVTCAQDTPNFKLGFTLTDGKDHATTVKVDNRSGTLKPILVCPKHDQSKQTILSMRALGKRASKSSSGENEVKPLMQLYLEDLVRNKVPRKLGPYLKSINYIENYKQFYHENDEVKDISNKSNTCHKCHTNNSPIWWTREENILCQSCYHGDQTEIIRDDSIGQPLNGENYGIANEQDMLGLAYVPNIVENDKPVEEIKPNEQVIENKSRSRISLGDILS
ncbi:SNT2 E3 ubiquitin-protein ligase SNT2 [Candida maltosa Xu316]|uniref:Uncharacterized protein n=1 Tax=Candida maltosa (strain Xu316) TaxID=1245528 RepID=M3JVV7_CANMX|nr:hypothetical protein G210_2675 [Candida maltosa Xu316]